MITMCFIKGEICEIIKGRKMEFLENKRKKCLDEMDGCFLCEMPCCARTFVVEQGWEISILSQLKTELMCHLAKLNYRANHLTVVCGNGLE